MTMWLQVLLSTCVLVGASMADPSGDLIQSLPGLKKQPSFKQYSGYLNPKSKLHYHYWFVESQTNTASDPVVLWLQGDPSCSSMLGLLTEHGPFRIQDGGETLEENPFSWNTVANMLYLDIKDTGFSYPYGSKDDDVYSALKDFFKKFPQYQNNAFFITSRGHGGWYVPILSTKVLADPSINFQGFAVGSSILSLAMNFDSQMYFANYHGLFGTGLWEDLMKHCCSPQPYYNCTFTNNEDTLCRKTMHYAFSRIRQLFDYYNYDERLNWYNMYQPCDSRVPTKNFTTSKFDMSQHRLQTANLGWEFSDPPSVQRDEEDYCIYFGDANYYMSSRKVRTALHISRKSRTWEACRHGDSDLDIDADRLSESYKAVLSKGKRVLVYNGDVDCKYNYLGREWFVDRLMGGEPMEGRVWTFRDKKNRVIIGGVFKKFKNISFVTVFGAGHRVATDRPLPALEMFTKFIRNKIWPIPRTSF